MEVMEGYKHSEIGAVPENWEVKPLIELCNANGLVRGPFGGALKKEIFVSEGYKVYEQQNAIYQDVELGRYYINERKFDELKRFEVKPYEFIVSCSGTIGKIFLLPKNPPKGVINQALLKISIDDEKINKYYFLQYFRWSNFQSRIIDNTQGGAMKNLVGMDVFRYTKFSIPPKKEQTAIATALSDTDALIESLEKLIEKKRNIKQGVMQELLKPKEGWKTQKLSEFLNYEQPTDYIVQDTEYSKNGNIPVLTAGKTFILGYTSEEFGIFSNLPVIIFDDFTTASKFVEFPFKVKSSAMKILKPKNEKVNLRFVFDVIQTIKFPLSDHKRYWISEYQNIEVLVPNFEEQNEIAKILTDLSEEISALQQKLNKYSMIKQGMMQVLLTGKIRLV